jgi:ribulose-phosphate 3-epimerase
MSYQSSSPELAARGAVDALEKKLGLRFRSAAITGGALFGSFTTHGAKKLWPGGHAVEDSDIADMVGAIVNDNGLRPLHIIPLKYNPANPVGANSTGLAAVFGFFNGALDGLDMAASAASAAYLEQSGYFDTQFLLGQSSGTNPRIIFDFGHSHTTASVWHGKLPLSVVRIARGGRQMTAALGARFGLNFGAATAVKHSAASMIPDTMDSIELADPNHDFYKSDANAVLVPIMRDIIAEISEKLSDAIERYAPAEIVITGGGAKVRNLRQYLEMQFRLPVANGPDAAAALRNFIWNGEKANIKKFLARRAKWDKLFGIKLVPRRKRRAFVPILPSAIGFDMNSTLTYEMFAAAGISEIHCDIMDGFYTSRKYGDSEYLANLRKRTAARLHVHLMTESPSVWAESAIAAGADTIVVSSGTYGLTDALKKIKSAGRRCGVALHPDTPVAALKNILKELDDIVVMSVVPGNSGAKFIDDAVKKISVLANTRRAYGLKFRIVVDGGINPQTAAVCWNAGADALISESFLARSDDFTGAVRSLIPDRH